MSGEATLRAENGGKPLGGRGSAPNPAAGELTALSQTIQLVERELLPLIKNPTPTLGLSVSPQRNILAAPLLSSTVVVYRLTVLDNAI